MGKYKSLAGCNVWLRPVHSVSEKSPHSCGGSICSSLPEPSFLSPNDIEASSNSYSHTVTERMVKKKAPTDMTATNQHIRNSGRGKTHQTSHQYRIIKVVANVVGAIIGLVVAVVMWVVVRPIFRGVGWLISILTVIAIIYWVLTF